ncbi:MAG: hypothetical protein IJB65_05765 [Clostridia bacterium]|nr:hypothetical protein [Clostridia bacterium]
MGEYIEREAVLTLIQKLFHNTRVDGEEQIGVLKCHRIIREHPTADVAEVVRCKDCEHYSLAMLKCCLPSDDEHSFDNYAPHIWQPNDFCSYGTPKERGGEK